MAGRGPRLTVEPPTARRRDGVRSHSVPERRTLSSCSRRRTGGVDERSRLPGRSGLADRHPRRRLFAASPALRDSRSPRNGSHSKPRRPDRTRPCRLRPRCRLERFVAARPSSSCRWCPTPDVHGFRSRSGCRLSKGLRVDSLGCAGPLTWPCSARKLSPTRFCRPGQPSRVVLAYPAIYQPNWVNDSLHRKQTGPESPAGEPSAYHNSNGRDRSPSERHQQTVGPVLAVRFVVVLRACSRSRGWRAGRAAHTVRRCCDFVKSDPTTGSEPCDGPAVGTRRLRQPKRGRHCLPFARRCPGRRGGRTSGFVSPSR